MKNNSLTLKAPAKINLGLSILRKLKNGYHEVKLIFSQVSLFDRIYLQEIGEDKILVFCDNKRIPLGKVNTVYQAARLLKRKMGIKKGVLIRLKKRIPVAAGLAGGSSDAAQTLIGLNKLWNLGLNLEELLKLGAKIGLDVCYQILGGTTLEIQGGKKGGKFQKLSPLPSTPVVICNPGLEIETAWAYKVIDYSQIGKAHLRELLWAIQKKDLRAIAKNLHNDFEYWIPRFYPVIKKIKYKMLKMGALGAVMTGSGPTVFAVCPNFLVGEKIYQTLKKEYPQTFLVETL